MKANVKFVITYPWHNLSWSLSIIKKDLLFCGSLSNLTQMGTPYTIDATQIAKTLGSMSIRYRSDANVSDRYLIDVDPRVFAIWTVNL